MDCPFCDRPKAHKHGKTSKGSQRYRCAACRRTFTDTFDTLYYRRQVTPEQVEIILQAHAGGSSLWGISRIGKRAYGTVVDIAVVDIVRKASYKGQLVNNEEVKDVECRQITADEMWSFVKKQKRCELNEIAVGDCWLGISLANESR